MYDTKYMDEQFADGQVELQKGTVLFDATVTHRRPGTW